MDDLPSCDAGMFPNTGELFPFHAGYFTSDSPFNRYKKGGVQSMQAYVYSFINLFWPLRIDVPA